MVFYLILALVSSSLVSIVMRVSEKYIKCNLGMTMTNYVICVLMAAVYSGVNNLFPRVEGSGFTLGLGLFTGVLYLAGLLLTQFNIKKNGVVLSSIFQKLGLVIQVLMSILIFGEHPKGSQIIGIVICLIAVVMINFEKEQTVIQFKLGLVLILLISGLCDGMSKVQEELGNSLLSEHFLFYTFGMALILCVGIIVVKKERIGWMDILFGVFLGVPNFLSCRFLLKSLETIPAIIAYPTFSVGAIVLITLAGLLVFREKLSKRQIMGIIMILFALVLLNI